MKGLRLPRFRLRTLMIAVAVVGLGFAAYRIDLTDWTVFRLYHECVVVLVPMACLLLFALIHAASDVWKGDECHPFLLGFEMVGWIELFALASFMAVNFENGRRLLQRIAPLTRWYVGGPIYA